MLCGAIGPFAAVALLRGVCAGPLGALPLGTPTTDWVTALGTAFAAIGTVGAVIIALWQTRRRLRYDIHVKCGLGVTGDPQIGDLVTLSAVNVGERVLTLTMAYLRLDNGRQAFAPFFTPHLGPRVSVIVGMEHSGLPKTLTPGESVEVQWRREILQELQDREGFKGYLYAFFTDQLDNVYAAPFPGMRRKQRWKWWGRESYVPAK